MRVSSKRRLQITRKSLGDPRGQLPPTGVLAAKTTNSFSRTKESNESAYPARDGRVKLAFNTKDNPGSAACSGGGREGTIGILKEVMACGGAG